MKPLPPYRTLDAVIFSRERATRKTAHWTFRDDLDDGVGHFETYATGGTIFFFVCPCGCKLACQLAVYTGEKGHGWKWNGDKEKPTLTPSIAQNAPCRWHGHLTAGQWIQAAPAPAK